jgi:3-deoxy-D-manno-octulosonate 8-phosphate phosphatase (KDO 8-P phosphatase)
MSIEQRAARIRLAIFDVDGVLTDGRLYFTERGEELKVFNVRDGHGIRMLRDAGIHVAVISGRESRAVAVRMSELGVEHVYMGRSNKLLVFDGLLRSLKLSAEVACYLGDDLPDLPVLRRCGLSVAVADAHPLVRERAHWVTTNPGGRGAAREVCELVLQAQGKLRGATGEPQ